MRCVATAATPSTATSPQPRVATVSCGSGHVASREVTGPSVQVNRADNGAPVQGLLFTSYTDFVGTAAVVAGNGQYAPSSAHGSAGYA
ncbi:hypothetical protein ACIGNX_01255 [Actinosynnema sp. NPDC053489]|uniref:hypothetical protein n=1 Tax=Actinosynnema sp. NPDC053489 TaxID=3363916 RepID=UPI0037C747A5